MDCLLGSDTRLIMIIINHVDVIETALTPVAIALVTMAIILVTMAIVLVTMAMATPLLATNVL